jgi:CRP/FNR family cyclic AMP-dependent transcriptional regulator
MQLHRNEKIEQIRNVSLFARLPRQGLNEVASLADEIALPEDMQLTREGERGREFLVLLDGSAEVRKKGRLLSTLGAGDFLGEIALVANVPRTATVTATSPVRALVITDRGFRTLLRRWPEISSGIVEALGERLTTELS